MLKKWTFKKKNNNNTGTGSWTGSCRGDLAAVVNEFGKGVSRTKGGSEFDAEPPELELGLLRFPIPLCLILDPPESLSESEDKALVGCRFLEP